MVAPIPQDVKKIWDEWNLRGFIILSFSLQTFLILCAPLRKRTSKFWLATLLWSAYLLSDWAAGFAIGLVSSSPGHDNTAPGRPGYIDDTKGNLLVLWASFLLLHLGGPDTIIAIAMEDSALWPRQLVGLFFHVIAWHYIFILSLPDNKLWIPSLLLSLAGIIKYGERTYALYLASLDGLKKSLIRKAETDGSYPKFMRKYSSIKHHNIPTHIELMVPPNREGAGDMEGGELEDVLAVVRCAYHFFKMSRRLVIGLLFSFNERKMSREFFLNTTPEQAFELLSVELNFIYEAFYTKVLVVHSRLGYFFRAVSFCTICVALVFFYNLEKRSLSKFDVRLTYTLLFGAIAVDAISVLMIVFSDRTVVRLSKSWDNSCIATLLKKYLHFKKSSWSTDKNCWEWTRKILFRRWSESVWMFNLIDYSIKERSKVECIPTDIDFFGLKNLRDRIKYTTSKPLSMNLWDFIFQQLKEKSLVADEPQKGKTICSARGDWILKDTCSDLLYSVVEFNYDQSILMWHIATELCYNLDKSNANDDHRKNSKTLSDYMIYLLVMQPTMMSSVAGIGQVEFWDTCAEAKIYFKTLELGGGVDLKLEDFCRKILEVNTDLPPSEVKWGKSKSVLFDACILAKKLMEKDNKWNVMAEVWVELLSYAASHSRVNSHAESMSKGGELVTFVWLLMARFGLAEQFQVKDKKPKAKLIVRK